jgi:hemolysin III
MTDRTMTIERSQNLGEEIANCASHGFALMTAIFAGAFLIASAGHAGAIGNVSAGVFVATMVLLYGAPTLYHAAPVGRAKRLLRKVDHSAIYLFIAGSYTPFALGALSGPWGWTLFGLVWSMATVGVTLKMFNRLSQGGVSTALYLVMGWLVVIAAESISERVALPGVALLLAGGIAYTVGVMFFVLDSRFHYSYAVWHCFVVAGTSCHFFAVLGYSA